MNCNTYQSEIEDLSGTNSLSVEGLKHLENCSDCRAFKLERGNLRQILQTLPPVDAPNDFNFRLKARLRQTQQNAPPFFGARTIWLTSSAAALCLALILTFVLIRGNAPVIQPETGVVASTQTQPMPVADATPNKTSPVPAIKAVLPNQQLLDSVARQSPANARARQRVVTNSASSHKVSPENEKEIFSRDSGLDKAKPSIIARGFNDPLAPPKKQTAAGLLRTVGIETETKTEGLFVVSVSPIGQAGRSGLQVGDIIEKVNGENPLAVSGSEFREFKLIVRRKSQTQEIVISTKPQD